MKKFKTNIELYLTGSGLDKIGEMYGCFRDHGEIDIDYRGRIAIKTLELSKVINYRPIEFVPDYRYSPSPIPWMEVFATPTEAKKRVDELSPSFPCPHPEWEGVWVNEYTKSAYKVVWDCQRWQWSVSQIHHGTAQYAASWKGPESEEWTQLETAPTASTAGRKLPRPQKHGGPSTPWDPWEVF